MTMLLIYDEDGFLGGELIDDATGEARAIESVERWPSHVDVVIPTNWLYGMPRTAELEVLV